MLYGTRINYFALLIVITVGVAVGNLISNLITAKYIEAEVEKETIEVSKVVPVAPSKQIAPANTQETIKLSPNNLWSQRRSKILLIRNNS